MFAETEGQGQGAPAERKVRYAVAGLGYFAQAEVLPAFARTENAELAAFISDDPVRHKKLGKRYRVSLLYTYEDCMACFKSGEIDALCIATADPRRRELVAKAAEAGIHVLCRAPLALAEEDGLAMAQAVERRKIRLMVFNGLEFDESHRKALEFSQAGKLGEVKAFQAQWMRPPEPGMDEKPGSFLFDAGADCVRTARKVFGAEPVEVFAYAGGGPFVTALLRFSNDRLASFTAGFGSADASVFQVFGSKGELRCDPAFGQESDSRHVVTIQGKRKERGFERTAAFLGELRYFSECVLEKRDPSPSVRDALADVKVIAALARSIREGRPASLAAPAPTAILPALPRTLLPRAAVRA